MENVIEKLLRDYRDIFIYGAGGVAKAVCRLLKEFCKNKVVHIVVTDVKKNPPFVEEYKVYDINDLQAGKYKTDALIVVAMMLSSAETVKCELLKKGFRNVMTADELAEKMYREFYEKPVQKGKILFVNFSGRGYGCNPKYICEEIIRRKIKGVDCLWAVTGSREGIPDAVRSIQYGTYEYYYELATAQIWVDNQHKDFLSRKRNGQYYIQTWHGCGPLKKIEYDAPNLPGSYLELLEHNMKMVDLCLSGTDFCSLQYRRAFHYYGNILEYGCPRNDVFFRKQPDIDNIKKDMGLPYDAAVILYAPTVRKGESNLIDASYILQACEKLYLCPCIMLIREHPQMAGREKRYVFSDRVVNASDYPDVQEILALADMLITDYSSVMWDFSLQKKPVFLYHPDADAYREERGFYIPFSEMPYIEAFSMEELYREICNYTENVYQQQLKKFFDKYKPFDQGKASQEVADRMLEVIGNGL